jgi:hypothetical protein
VGAGYLGIVDTEMALEFAADGGQFVLEGEGFGAGLEGLQEPPGVDLSASPFRGFHIN